MVADKKTRMLSPDSVKKILDALREDRTALGPRLGYAAYNARVPAAVIADLMPTSEQSVYRWYYGVEPRRSFRKKIRALTEILQFATKSGYLPVPGTHADVTAAITQAAIVLKTQRRTEAVAE
jgi:hypothetical protein